MPDGVVILFIGCGGLQVLYGLIASFRYSQRHLLDQRVGYRLSNGLNAGPDIGNRDVNAGRLAARICHVGPFGIVLCLKQRSQRMEIVLNILLKLLRRNAVCLLDGFFYGHLLHFYQSKISAGFRKLVFIQQVMHDHPGLSIEQRLMRAFDVIRALVLSCEQVLYRQPGWRTENFCQ